MRPVRIEPFSGSGKSKLMEVPAARTAGWRGDVGRSSSSRRSGCWPLSKWASWWLAEVLGRPIRPWPWRSRWHARSPCVSSAPAATRPTSRGIRSKRLYATARSTWSSIRVGMSLSRPIEYAWGIVAVGACTAVCQLMFPTFQVADLIMVYLLGVVTVSTRFSLYPSIFTAWPLSVVRLLFSPASFQLYRLHPNTSSPSS